MRHCACTILTTFYHMHHYLYAAAGHMVQVSCTKLMLILAEEYCTRYRNSRSSQLKLVTYYLLILAPNAWTWPAPITRFSQVPHYTHNVAVVAIGGTVHVLSNQLLVTVRIKWQTPLPWIWVRDHNGQDCAYGLGAYESPPPHYNYVHVQSWV
jgi:hypothetical protein